MCKVTVSRMRERFAQTVHIFRITYIFCVPTKQVNTLQIISEKRAVGNGVKLPRNITCWHTGGLGMWCVEVKLYLCLTTVPGGCSVPRPSRCRNSPCICCIGGCAGLWTAMDECVERKKLAPGFEIRIVPSTLAMLCGPPETALEANETTVMGKECHSK